MSLLSNIDEASHLITNDAATVEIAKTNAIHQNCPERQLKSLSQKQKLKLSQGRYGEILGQLGVRYPEIFNISEPKILKIGIHKDIIADGCGISGKDIRRFCARYTRKNAYLRKLNLGCKRYNLQGEIVGEVSDENNQWAMQQLSERSGKLI
jgi:sRNA-binding protein